MEGHKALDNHWSNTPLFITTHLQHETPRTIAAGEWVDSIYCLALASLDDHLFICFECIAVWQGHVTYPHIYSLSQVGINVINVSFDRRWKVSPEHERTSMAGFITHSVMFTGLAARVSRLYGFVFTKRQHDIVGTSIWCLGKITIKWRRWKRGICPLHLNSMYDR